MFFGSQISYLKNTDMAIDYKVALHQCRVLGRQIKVSYPELTPVFIVHEEKKRKEAIDQEAQNILDHPAGESILNYIKKIAGEHPEENRSKFAGLAEYFSPGFLGFFRSREIICLFFVNVDRFDLQDDLKNQVLHMVWHALALYDDYMEGMSKSSGRKKQTEKAGGDDKKSGADNLSPSQERFSIIDGEVIIPKLSIQELCHRNLLADIFSSTLQYLHEQEDAIRKLAIQRMRDTLTPQVGFIAEKYPFPISLETLEFLFSENIKTLNKKQRVIPQAVKITKDIGSTYKISAIKQWRSFSIPAQEMAWCGFAPETILGAAIYTNENTYVRSIADMIAEYMEIKPEIFSSLDDYNPFADQELNQRLHENLCRKDFQSLLDKLRTRDDYISFLRMANKHNDKMKNGNPVGWASHALITVSDIIRSSKPRDSVNNLKPVLQQTFEEQMKKIDWKNIRSVARYLFRKKRDGIEINYDLISNIPEKNEDIKIIKSAFETLHERSEELNDDIEIRGMEDAKGFTGNISKYISPNALK